MNAPTRAAIAGRVRRWFGAWDRALLLLTLALLFRLCATRFVLELSPDATRAYQLARAPGASLPDLLAAGGLPLAIALASAGLGPLHAYLVNVPLLVGVAALVWELGRRLAAARGAQGSASARLGGAAALAGWLCALAAGRSHLLELVNPYPDPLRVAVPLLLLALLHARGRIQRRTLAVALSLGVALAALGAVVAPAGARGALWLASLGAPLAGAALAALLRAALGRLPEPARARSLAGSRAAAWLGCLLALADAGARGWVAPGEIGRDSERVQLEDLARLREALHAAVPPGAAVAVGAPLARLLRVFGERELLGLDPAGAAGPAGAAWLRRVESLRRAEPERVFAATGAAGAARDPVEQLLAGDFDLIPVASLAAAELRLGRWLGGRERLEFARVAAWSQSASRAARRHERGGDAWIRADVGHLSQLARERAALYLDGALLGPVRTDFANDYYAAALAVGTHELELRSDAPVPRRLGFTLHAAHEGLEWLPEDPEQALALRARVRRELAPERASSALELLLPTPSATGAVFLLELELALGGDPERAARHHLELVLGGRSLLSEPLGSALASESGELRYPLCFGVAGADLPGPDAPLALRLRAPDAAGAPAALRILRVRIDRFALREPFDLELGRRDRPFLIEGFGGRSELGPLRVRAAEASAELYVFVPRKAQRAWLELEYVDPGGAAAMPRFAWDGRALPAGLRSARRVELDSDQAVRLVRERIPLEAERLLGPIHRLGIEIARSDASAPARAPALLLHRVRVATRASALDAPAPARRH